MDKKIKFQIRYAKLEDVDSISGNSINLIAGKTFSQIAIYNSTLRQSLKESPHGDFVEQKLGLKDIVSADTLNSLKNPHIFELTLFDGTVFIWGSVVNPVILADASLNDGATDFTLIRKTPDFE